MKNILNKIYFHPIFLISILIFISIGKFRFISYFMLLIVIHEIGHILVGSLFKWDIEKIIILPFGALTKFNKKINTLLIEDFLVSISGILVQLLIYFILKNKINYNYFSFINYFIIIFNLIPIYPLDGSKILHVIFNIFTTFKNSILLTVILSYILIIILSIISIKTNKLFTIILMFLFNNVNKLYKNKQMLLNKFLLERHLNDFKFRKKKTITKVDYMKKDYKHLFYIDDRYLTEKYFLLKLFSKN